jgi:hypothetical protein
MQHIYVRQQLHISIQLGLRVARHKLFATTKSASEIQDKVNKFVTSLGGTSFKVLKLFNMVTCHKSRNNMQV